MSVTLSHRTRSHPTDLHSSWTEVPDLFLRPQLSGGQKMPWKAMITRGPQEICVECAWWSDYPQKPFANYQLILRGRGSNYPSVKTAALRRSPIILLQHLSFSADKKSASNNTLFIILSTKDVNKFMPWNWTVSNLRISFENRLRENRLHCTHSEQRYWVRNSTTSSDTTCF